MRPAARRNLAAGFALLAGIVLAAGWAIERQVEAQRWLRHTMEVENAIQQVLIDAQDAETSQRSYLLTGQPGFVDRFARARRAAPADLDRLARLTPDNPEQHARVQRLRAAVDRRLQLSQATIARRRGGELSADELRAYLGQGTAAMDEVRRLIGDMAAAEGRLLDVRAAQVRRSALQIETIIALLALGIVALAVVTVRAVQQQVDALRASDAALRQANAELTAQAEARGRAEAQLHQVQKMESLGQLTGGIAHDFNNMLAVVIGSLELAQRRFGDDPRRAERHIAQALEGAQRAAELTARLLAFSRRQPLNPRPLDVNRFVSGMSELLRRALGEHIGVETVLAGGLWRATADAAQLESAILNLAVNARDVMEDGGRLTIETANAHLDEAYAAAHEDVAAGQYVMISVTDTGAGMSPEVMRQAFEPFFTTKDPGRGTGLGLSQVYGFIKQSGGHAAIYSEPGQGTTVKLYLPRGRSAGGEEPAAAAAGPIPLPRAQAQEIVLVVEDEERVRQVTVDQLCELGYEVRQAAGGVQALSVLAAEPRVDLMFTDVVMPGMNGRQLADEVRRLHPQVRILFATGYTRNAIVHNGVLDEGVELISKPFTQAQLARKVRQVLDAAPA